MSYPVFIVYPVAQKRYEDSNLYPQHLTWVTEDREPYFSNDLASLVCIWALEKERRAFNGRVWGYCLMPDHIHMLIAPTVWKTGDVVKWLKLASAFHLKAAGLCKKTPWARGYWDRAMRSADDVITTLNYIHDNPVKSGACDGYESWIRSSWQDYEGRGESVITISRPEI